MSFPSESPVEEGEEERLQESAYHPSAPSHELFDISTTVDPSYVISLIRKLLPRDLNTGNNPCEIDVFAQESKSEGGIANSLSESGTPLRLDSEIEATDAAQNFGELDGPEMSIVGLRHQGGSVAEEVWEQYGCILWDLAASRTHAELMVQNLVLEVLMATLVVSQSARVTEISLGILGNLACHDISRKQMVSNAGLIEIIMDLFFLDDTPSLCEAFRLLTLCLQGREDVAVAEALQSEHILSRILWIAENTLNLQLMEKSLGLLLAISESPRDVAAVILPPLLKLGLPRLLINLLSFEMSKLTGERAPDRYSVLDIILRTIEALSVIDECSPEICSNKELFQQLNDLVKLPDKIEVANSCVAAVVLIANILTDSADLALDISKDLFFLQGVLDVFAFASDDIEARSAIWSIVAKLLVQVQESEMSPSSLHQYVLVLASKSDVIEEELLDHQLDGCDEECESSTSSSAKLIARTAAMKRIFSLLSRWKTLKRHFKDSDFLEVNHVNEGDVDKLLACCCKYTSSDTGSCARDDQT